MNSPDFGLLDTPEPKRDRYGRYLIVPEGGGKPKAMTRMTTVSGTLESRAAIEKWQQRHVAVGLASRPDLVAQVQSTTVDDKQTLNSVCQKALDAAAADSAATLGTALHKVLERVVLDPSFVPPDMFAGHVERFRAALVDAGLTICTDAVERIHVLEQYGIAGMADAHAVHGPSGRRVVVDYKTGASVDFGAGGWAVQLAGYSRATSLYRPEDGTHEPMPDVDQERAVVVHLPAKGGPCTVWWLDIAAGAVALEHAVFAHRWRSRKDLLAPFDVPAATNTDSAPVEAPETRATAARVSVAVDRRERLLEALRAVRDLDADAFVARWRSRLADVPAPNRATEWDGATMDAVERAFELAWTDDTVPTVAPTATLPEPQPETPVEDHGGQVPADTLTELRTQVAALPRKTRALMAGWDREAVDAGLSWRMGRGRHVSWQSWWTTRAGMLLAVVANDSDVSDVRLVVESVCGPSTGTVGATLARMTLDDAKRVAKLAEAVTAGRVHITAAGLLEETAA